MSNIDDFELLNPHAERLSQTTYDTIRIQLETILDRFGTVKDAEISRFDASFQELMLDILRKHKMTEETPIVRQAWRSIPESRLLPPYLNSSDNPVHILISESLASPMPFKYRVFYGLGPTPDVITAAGPEIWLPASDSSKTVILSRDPSTNETVSSIFTEAQGRDLVLDLEYAHHE